MEDSRSYKAGKAMALAIIEMVHLMYQNDSARKFFTALYTGIVKEMKRRGIVV